MAQLAGFVGNVKLRLQVDNATSNSSDDPTPIYVLDELLAALSSGDSRAGVDAVCARLTHRSPVVKQKALKLVTHIGRKGSPDLRRLMARHSGAVRDLLHYRCDPDPFKGDTVWKRVQEYAQEALEAVHGEAAQTSGGGAASSSLGGRIQGFGSDASGGYGSTGGMKGFGSESAGQGSGTKSSSRMLGFGSADVARQDGYSSALGSGGGSSSYGGGYSGRAGGTAGASSQPIMQAGIAGAGASAAPAAAAGTAAGGAHAAEQRLVDRICTPAGLRAAPGSEDLRAFVEGLAPLDGAVVAQLLEKKMEAGPWQSTLRALCALEAVLEGGSSTPCGQLAVHFQANPEPVRRAARSPQASVRQRADKLLAMLGDQSAGSGATAAQPAHQQQQQQLITEDLLGEAAPSGMSSSAAPAGLADLLAEPAAPAVAAPPPPAAPADLLAGLDVPSSATISAPPAAHAAAADDLFGGMLLGGGSSTQQAAPPAASAQVGPAAPIGATGLDLLGSLSFGSGAAALPPALQAMQPPPQPPPPQQQQARASGGLDDLLGGLSLGPAPTAAAAGGLGVAAPAPGLAGTGRGMSPGLGGGGMMGRGGIAASGMAGMAPGGIGGMSGMGGGPLLGSPGLGAPAYGAAPTLGMAAPGMAAAPFDLMGLGGPLHSPQLAPPLGLAQAHPHQPYLHPQQQQQGHVLGTMGSGGLGATHAGVPPHRLQPSLNGGSAVLGELGILDSAKDNSFNFVDDAIAAARRKH